MKKILMIGAGIGQTYLAKKIKERGHYLLTVTIPGNYPVISIADKVLYHDVFDKEGVLELARNESIEACISDQNDTMMPTVAYIVEHMKLPGLKESQVNAYCDKNTFRANCDKLEIPVPRHIKVSAHDILSDLSYPSYPCIVKPADSQSSMGVVKVYDNQECMSAIENALQYSRSKSAIVEEFFDGEEFVAEGFIYKGMYYNLGFADRKYFELNNKFIPAQTVFPSTQPKPLFEKIILCEQKMANYIKPDFAIVHSEYLYNAKTDEYRIVESALRGGGVYISSHLIPLYCGIDINDILLDCIEGKNINMDLIMSKRKEMASAYVCFYLPAGKIKSIDGIEELNSLDYVKMACLDGLYVGRETTPLNNKGQRLGPIIVNGHDRRDIENKIKYVQDLLKVVVIDKNGFESGIIWE